MTKEVATATEETGVSAIADLLSEHRIKQVPIARNGKIVGIVSGVMWCARSPRRLRPLAVEL
jgi:CBS domain-containing protein